MSDYIVGLTGGIGSGKTTIATMFEHLGVTIVDADVVAREVVAVGSIALAEISTRFGEEFILEDGSLNRALLRKKIFSAENDKIWLNNLLHPLIRAQLINQTTAATSQYCLLVVPLLLENKLTAMVNRVLVIDVSEQTQIVRTQQRDHNSIKQIKAIIASQIGRADRLAMADDVIDNEQYSLAPTQNLVLKLHHQYLMLASPNHTNTTI